MLNPKKSGMVNAGSMHKLRGQKLPSPTFAEGYDATGAVFHLPPSPRLPAIAKALVRQDVGTGRYNYDATGAQLRAWVCVFRKVYCKLCFAFSEP